MSVYVCRPFNMAGLLAIRAAQDRAQLDRNNRVSIALDAYRQAYLKAFAMHRPVDKSEAIESLKLALEIAQSGVLIDYDADALAGLLPGILDDLTTGSMTGQTLTTLRFAIEVAELAEDLVTAGLLIGVLEVMSRPLPFGG